QLREGWTPNSPLSKYIYLYDIKDHLGNVRLVHDDSEQAKIYQGNYYSAFGVSILSLGDNMTPTQTVLSNDRLYNGKELQDGTNWLDYGARMYYPELGRWMAVDPSHEDGGQESSTPYGYVFNNPAGHTDPDGRIPHVVAGAIAGGLIGGAIEAGRQVWNEGKVSDWRAVGGAAVQGAITGGVAAATGGANLLGTAAISGAANGVGGAVNNAIQGKSITAGSVIRDVAIGAASGLAGKLIGNAIGKYKIANPCGCFTQGTKVLTNFGYKKIELIKKGDKVWSYDVKRNRLGLKLVTRTFNYTRDTVYAIYIDNQVIKASADHPFYIEGRWLNVKSLKVGQKVKLLNGKYKDISAIKIIIESTEVFNFTVSQYHTYFVSNSNILVHNNNCNLNTNSAKSHFGLYEIKIGDVLHKVGKADLSRITKSSGLPTRLHQQLRLLRKAPENAGKTISGYVTKDLGVTTTEAAKQAETQTIQSYYNQTGTVLPGNVKSFKPQ
ncbi:polymorphic toxin-type HINT domain-containing protein, partial [Cellulophaga sp. BC115SP]|uniref:polymorphic toxin-type HINT domain-containing protein n=1 Tax=Cellulophaga sp. BC115SP TaxID=2683263 RepID=UPI002101F33B